jgi:tRNA modification GTPase
MQTEDVVDCFAAQMTGAGSGAIATVQVFGDSARKVFGQVFAPSGTKSAEFRTGRILLGAITDGEKIIDQVTIGCEAPGTFAIHCHGNPLIVEMIMQRLQYCGVTLLTAEQLRARILTEQTPGDPIAVEAKLAQAQAKTLLGTKTITNQINSGLGGKLRGWLAKIDEIPLDEIKTEATRILQASQAAKLIIYGCTAVLAGPPNSGKSTLLNYLAGRQKAIVTDIRGTTRDWIEATCQIGTLALTLIDTAGLEDGLGDSQDTIGAAAQKKTSEVLERADLVLLLLNNSQPVEQFAPQFIETIAGKRVITALNKSDLSPRLDMSRLPNALSNAVHISAKNGDGIENLKQQIQQTTGVSDIDPKQPVCFTKRQESLLERLTTAQSKQQAVSIIGELLNGQVQPA